MTLWGRAWDYQSGVAIQAYLTLRPDGADSAKCQERLVQRFLRALGQNGKT